MRDTSARRRRTLGRSRATWTSLILVILASAPSIPQTAPSSTPQLRSPKVVIVNSYHNGYEWSDAEQAGVTERLAEKYPDISPSVEYLDTKRFSDKGHLQTAADYLIRKYRGVKVDLVIALDNPAFDLVRERTDLFSGVPVVFAGYNSYTPDVLKSRPKVTGLAENDDTEGTIRLALSLFPATKLIYDVNDMTYTGRTADTLTRRLVPKFQDRVSFVFAPPQSYQELSDSIAALPPDSIVLIGAYAADSNGVILSSSQSTARITDRAKVPVFAVVATRLGYGIIGGNLTAGRDHGRTAGSIAIHVLSGDDPDWIPVIQGSTARPMFDYTLLERFKISLGSLPPGSVVVNKPESILEKYRTMVFTALAVFAALFTLVVILSIAIVRRRMAERELAKSRNRVRTIIDSSADMIIAVDLKGVITDCSPSIRKILGYSPQEVIGRHSEMLHLSTERYRRFVETALPEIGTRGSWRGEWEYRGRDGQGVDLEVTMSALTSHDGRTTGYSGVARDIREKRQSQDALRQAEEKLRQALKMEAVGRLAGGVAHDFNNLLTVIKGYGDMALERTAADPELSSDMKEIIRAAEQASLLTGQLLAFSRKQVFQPRVFDRNAHVGELLSMLRRMIGEDIELSAALSPSPLNVNADPGQIEQALMNLALNSRDAMPQGGTLSIVTAESELPAAAGGDGRGAAGHPADAGSDGQGAARFAALTVRDTGRGMDRESLAHLFEPFYSTKERGRGTGLGLSTVYGIVKQSEGHITCESEPGKGTAFTLYFPLCGSAASAQPGGRVTLKGSESILLVEDEEAVRKFVKTTLSSRGFSVLESSGGMEALSLISNGEAWADLVITDVIMPGMSGRQLAEQIRRFLPRTKILFISGYTGGAMDAHGGEPEVSPLLQKPFGPEELVRKVRAVLDQA